MFVHEDGANRRKCATSSDSSWDDDEQAAGATTSKRRGPPARRSQRPGGVGVELIDLVGPGRLKVIARAGSTDRAPRRPLWRFRFACGRELIVLREPTCWA